MGKPLISAAHRGLLQRLAGYADGTYGNVLGPSFLERANVYGRLSYLETQGLVSSFEEPADGDTLPRTRWHITQAGRDLLAQEGTHGG